MPFIVEEDKSLGDVKIVTSVCFEDERGWFAEVFRLSDFTEMGLFSEIDQINHSFSASRGTLRGLHYQESPEEQGKFVCCLKGEIFDVAVDIREGSKTFGKWTGHLLNPKNRKSLWIPPGFAHGFQTTCNDVEVIYLPTGEYSPKHDRSIRWNDSDIGVNWPIKDAILSDKDVSAPYLREI